MSDDARFDPRFDPAFQPGYAGPIASEQPAARPVQAPAVTAAPPTALPNASAPVPESMTDETAADGRVNPFIVALGVVSLVLVLSGFALISLLQQMFEASQGSQTNFDYATFQALVYGAPFLMVLGIATAIGILFIFAVRWWRLQR